ncbi:hypothetical protein D3C81_2153050 [compost metagenome]
MFVFDIGITLFGLYNTLSPISVAVGIGDGTGPCPVVDDPFISVSFLNAKVSFLTVTLTALSAAASGFPLCGTETFGIPDGSYPLVDSMT